MNMEIDIAEPNNLNSLLQSFGDMKINDVQSTQTQHHKIYFNKLAERLNGSSRDSEFTKLIMNINCDEIKILVNIITNFCEIKKNIDKLPQEYIMKQINQCDQDFTNLIIKNINRKTILYLTN